MHSIRYKALNRSKSRLNLEDRGTEDFKMTSNFRNSVVSEDSFEVLPGEQKWMKVLCSRTTGDHVDVYIYTSDGKKLRSSPELLDYIAEHSQYWERFDPTLINFERNKKETFGWGTRKIINFLESVRKGATKEEALESVKHAIKQPLPTRPKVNEFHNLQIWPHLRATRIII